MSHATSRTFSSDFKRFFVRGLVVLLPSVLTLWIVVKAYQFVDTTIAQPINSGIKTALVQATGFWAPLQQSFDPSDEQLVEAIRKDNQARRVPLTPDRATAELGPTVRTRLRAEAIRTWWGERWYMDLIGLMVAVIAVYIAGRLLGGFVGRTLYKKLEGLITQVPIFKQVYPYVKQVV
ncbi:MAG: DUF502 domain-containing protein, partial [Phycisphaerales bacterium]|nr:DUF502 domain-containing protein [Phycisphaerales bacterium]